MTTLMILLFDDDRWVDIPTCDSLMWFGLLWLSFPSFFGRKNLISWDPHINQQQRNKGRVAVPKRMSFRKSSKGGGRVIRLGTGRATKLDEFSEKKSKRPSTPHSFSENYVANFLWQIWLHICKEVWWPDSIKCVHMISRGGPTAVLNLSENSSNLVAWPIP